MAISIKDILASFRIKKPVEKQIEEALKDFFVYKNIKTTGLLKTSLVNKVLHVGGDPYVASYVKINKGEVLNYLSEKLPLFKIEDIN